MLLRFIYRATAELVDDVEAFGVPTSLGRSSAHDLRACLVTDELQAAAFEQRRQLAPELGVIAT
jgi:hypothetical protein